MFLPNGEVVFVVYCCYAVYMLLLCSHHAVACCKTKPGQSSHKTCQSCNIESVFTWICQNCYINLLKSLHRFVKAVICFSRRLRKKPSSNLAQIFKLDERKFLRLNAMDPLCLATTALEHKDVKNILLKQSNYLMLHRNH